MHEETYTEKAMTTATKDAYSRRCRGHLIGLSGSFAARLCDGILEAIGSCGNLCMSALSRTGIMGSCSAWFAISAAISNRLKVNKCSMSGENDRRNR
jgi:hypothetical protein